MDSDDNLSLFGIEKLDIKEDGDWTVVDPKKMEIKEEELEDGFTKLEFIQLVFSRENKMYCFYFFKF